MRRDRAAGRVIVGVDRSPSGLQALRRGLAEAYARQSELHAVRVWTTGRELGEEAARTVDAALTDSVGRVPPEVTLRQVARAGAPGPTLVGYANRDDDLLVLGGGSGPGWRRPLGSRLVRYCVRRASCPLLVVPPPPLTRGKSHRGLVRELRQDLQRRGW
jgi:nucleotide-binding universal stress UspA family protein